MSHDVELLSFLDAPWRMDAVFATILAAALTSGKVISAVIGPGKCQQRIHFLLLAPMLSIDTWHCSRAVKVDDLKRLILTATLTFCPLLVFYWYLRPAISSPEIPWLIRSYLCLLPYLLATTGIGATFQILAALFGIHVPPLHQRPWLSRSVAEFWGRRWNCIVGDWLRQVCFQPLRRRPRAAIVTAFAASGLGHELFLNLPLFFYSGAVAPGSMALYFAIQAAGVFVERAWLRQSQLVARVFAWCIVLLPAPVVLNEGMLRLFQFVN
jgi:Membrane bound O-acyl transferase family